MTTNNNNIMVTSAFGYPIDSAFTVKSGKAGKNAETFKTYEEAANYQKEHPYSILSFHVSVPEKEVEDIRIKRANKNGY